MTTNNIWMIKINIWLVIGSRVIDSKQGGTHFMAREGAGPVISVHHQDGDDGVAECTVKDLLAVADTGQPWISNLSNETGRIKVFASRNIDEQILINQIGCIVLPGQ